MFIQMIETSLSFDISYLNNCMMNGFVNEVWLVYNSLSNKDNNALFKSL